MAKKKAVRPTDGELEILRVLWADGPGTVRQIHQTLQAGKDTSYNTTLKLLQIMHAKGVVLRDASRRPQVYRAAIPQEQMQGRLVRDFLQRVFGGSAGKLVAAVAAGDISPRELAQIRQVIDRLQEGKP